MPRVRFNTRFASPEGNFEPGQEADLPHHQANALVKAGSAVLLGAAPKAEPQGRQDASSKPPRNAGKGGKGGKGGDED